MKIVDQKRRILMKYLSQQETGMIKHKHQRDMINKEKYNKSKTTRWMESKIRRVIYNLIIGEPVHYRN